MSICVGKWEGAGTVDQVPAPVFSAPRLGEMGQSQPGTVGVYMFGKVGGVETRLLVDTGAQVSIVPKQFWLEATGGVGELVEYNGSLSVANGEKMEAVGQWTTICQFDSLAVVMDFVVADINPGEVLLGSDFLVKFGAKLDLGELCCYLMGKKIVIQLQADFQVPPLPVVVCGDTRIPPRSEVLILGSVEGAPSERIIGMLEPGSSLPRHCDVLVARVVCSVTGGVMPVRVINVTEEAHTLRDGMKIGVLSTNIEVGEGAEEVEQGGGVKTSWSADALISYLGLDSRGFDAAQMHAIGQILEHYNQLFSTGDTDLGRTHLVSHQIDTGSAPPIKIAPRRVPLHLQQEVTDHIKQMLDNGIIQPSCSPWAAPVVPVRKKDGSLRFCIDYRKLNEVTQKDAYPLPRIDDALDSLTNAGWFSTLDLASGYWQVEVDPKDKPKTAFITRQGLFEFNVLSYGLCNSPSTFQRLMDLVLADLQWTTCLVYLDDIIVFGKTFQEHLGRLEQVFRKLHGANLKVKPSKCNLFAKQVSYLGHIISANGVKADPSKVEAVRGWPVPRNQTEVRSFLGLASYYRRFIKSFAEIARPLHQLTEKGRKFHWGDDCQRAFLTLKSCLTSAPVLAYPDPLKQFILDTDASDVGIGAVLSQVEGGMERVVAYASRSLTKQERKYATTKKELLSMVTFTKYFKHYLLGAEFVLRTDHNSLRWLHNFQGIEGQLARWLEQLSSFQYKIVHRPGKQHSNTDALSRLPALNLVSEMPGQVGHIVSGGTCPVRVVQVSSVSVGAPPIESLEDDLIRLQREDSELGQLLQWLSKSPEERGMIGDHPELRKFAVVCV